MGVWLPPLVLLMKDQLKAQALGHDSGGHDFMLQLPLVLLLFSIGNATSEERKVDRKNERKTNERKKEGPFVMKAWAPPFDVGFFLLATSGYLRLV